MATAQRTRSCAVVGAPRRAAWQPKSVLRHSVSVAPRTMIFYVSFTIIAGKLFLYVQQWLVMIRGGVEDTRLEAKAKDIKKIRGQGQEQPFRGQTLSRPRTGMLEAKDTSASALQKKRSSKNFFRRSPKKNKGLHRNFSSDLHKNTFSKKFFKNSTKFQQFKKYCCPRAEDRPIFEDLRPRGQGQGLQNTSSRPRTSSRTPPLVMMQL